MTQPRTLRCTLRHDIAQRPGFLWRVSYMFCERGINIDEIVVHRPGEHTAMVICFQANDAQLVHLQRRLQRFDGVVDLAVVPQDFLTPHEHGADATEVGQSPSDKPIPQIKGNG